MKTRTIALKHEPAVVVDATLCLSGKPVVTIHGTPGRDDLTLRPAEAEKLAAALIAGARTARKAASCPRPARAPRGRPL